MAKKHKSIATSLDEVDRTMYVSICAAANSLSQLYIHSMNHQKFSFQADTPFHFLTSMELQLGLALPTNHSKDINDGEVVLPTLSLLPLTPGYPKVPNHDDNSEDHRSSCSTITKNDGNDVESPVGWPPVNSWRKKLHCDSYEDKVVVGNDQMVWVAHHHVSSRASNALYVKVKMDGVGIARKVDLSLHHSFQTLKEISMDMFGTCNQHSNCYELGYLGEEGYWLLADDVSCIQAWKSSGANVNIYSPRLPTPLSSSSLLNVF